MKISSLAQIRGDTLEEKSVEGRERPSCPLRADGDFDRNGVGVDGEKWGCFLCRLETESTSLGYSHERIKKCFS